MSVEVALPAAESGLVAVADRLAAATVVDGRLRVDGDPLMAAVLDGVVNEAADDLTAIVGTHDGPLRAGVPIVVAVDPRVDDASTPLARTFVVDGSGGWERRAAVAVEMAHDAVRRVAEPGVPARRIVDEAVAELAAYGLGTGEGAVARGLGTDIDFSTDTSLAAGQRFVLDPTAVAPDADRGAVRIGAWYAVTDEGCRRLGDLPTSLSPDAY
ncbi:M24 family metallopeptidase [Haloplanus aerogenes]|uniref:M24 family metallopeptidase n=1 Tax=Haloplanus aerogenes TaxID=660522 RepID=A0A3G8R1I9_9EURY|nr:M24 family metallopeptidase [Haloplanus aerogenes]AZH26884.1 M24 family metallopeptidase [Haloplanus aerogenes]